jgi:hypothetical protein
MQTFDGLAPVTMPDQVVPVRNEVAKRAALIAERDSTVHTAAGLGLEVLLRKGLVDLLPVT